MKKTKQNRIRKLTISRETIRSLQNAELQKVAGGFSGETSCTPECNIDSNPCETQRPC